jgi:uncharacterized membrane protein
MPNYDVQHINKEVLYSIVWKDKTRYFPVQSELYLIEDDLICKHPVCYYVYYLVIYLTVHLQTSTPLQIIIFPSPAHPKFNTITILTTDFHPIGRIHIISRI